MEKEPEYTIREVEGVEFRCVNPYTHYYTTHCKERWRGMNIFSMFLQEFKAYSEDYYKEAIVSGAIQVNFKKVSLDYVIKNGDTITHMALRNEPPVLNIPVEVIYESPNLLIVRKPPSMPVHPSGAYYKNSMLYILENEMGYKNVHLIHRLDRVTSGIIILGKNPQVASTLTQLFQEKSMQKYYMARVKGNFPYNETEINEKIICVDHKDGVYKVDPGGKESCTMVRKMFYDEKDDQSVVECRPLTGRTHQIRVHLSHLGYPIANDTAYGGSCLNPVKVPDNLYRLEFGDKRIKLEKVKQLEIWLCSVRYVITQNLDFSIPFPRWALR